MFSISPRPQTPILSGRIRAVPLSLPTKGPCAAYVPALPIRVSASESRPLFHCFPPSRNLPAQPSSLGILLFSPPGFPLRHLFFCPSPRFFLLSRSNPSNFFPLLLLNPLSRVSSLRVLCVLLLSWRPGPSHRRCFFLLRKHKTNPLPVFSTDYYRYLLYVSLVFVES